MIGSADTALCDRQSVIGLKNPDRSTPSLNICYVIYVLLWIKYWLTWFEILLVFILFKFKKRPNIPGIQVV